MSITLVAVFLYNIYPATRVYYTHNTCTGIYQRLRKQTSNAYLCILDNNNNNIMDAHFAAYIIRYNARTAQAIKI